MLNFHGFVAVAHLTSEVPTFFLHDDIRLRLHPTMSGTNTTCEQRIESYSQVVLGVARVQHGPPPPPRSAAPGTTTMPSSA